MAVQVKLSTAVKNGLLAYINTQLGANALCKFYVDSSLASLIATVPLNTTSAFGTPSAGAMALNAIPAPVSCTGAGTPTWCTFTNSAGTVIFEGTVGGSGAVINLTFAGPYSIGDGITISSGSISAATP